MTFLETILSEQMIRPVGWTLIHFLWQGILAAMLLWFLLRICRKASANVRYVIACAALLVLVCMPAVTFCVLYEPPVETATLMPIETVESAPAMPIATESVVITAPAAPIPTPKASLVSVICGYIETALPWCVLGWFIGVVMLSVWYLGGWCQLQKLRRIGTKAVGDTVAAKAGKLSARLGIRRGVQIVESALVQVPTVIGWLKPVVLLPASALTGLDEVQLSALIAHELAHVKRCDYLVNIVQTIVEILGFYHPALWWMSRQIRIERENCCDDMAVALLQNKRDYAGALFTMETIRSRQLELAVAANGGSLTSRISRLAGKENPSKQKPGWIPSIVILAMILAIVIPTAFALSNKRTDNAKDITARKIQMQEWVEDFFNHNYRDITSRKTLEWGEPTQDSNGNYSIRYKYEAVIWRKNTIVSDELFTFDEDGKFVSVKKLNRKELDQDDVNSNIQIYQINRNVSEFPEKEDFSTPENAYVAINRVMAANDYEGWQRVSVKSLAGRLAKEQKIRNKKVEPEWAKVVLNANILEVRIHSDQAVVIAEFPQAMSSKPIRNPIDYRHLIFEDGKWLNTGENRYDTVDAARAKFKQTVAQQSNKEQNQQSVSKTGSILEFRLLAELRPEQLERVSWPESNLDGYQWMKVRKQEAADWNANTLHRRVNDDVYVLVSSREGEAMPADGSWGLLRAGLTTDAMNKLALSVDLDEPSQEKFHALTQKHVKRQLAICLDGEVISAPTIMSAIRNRAIITGNFTEPEAKAIVEALKNGMPPTAADEKTAPGKSVSKRVKPAMDKTQMPGEVRDIFETLEGMFKAIMQKDLQSFSTHLKSNMNAENTFREFAELMQLNPDWKLSLLSVYWDNDSAMAVVNKLRFGNAQVEGPETLVFNLQKENGRWLIADIDLEEPDGLQIENARFLKENPGAGTWYIEPGRGPVSSQPGTNSVVLLPSIREMLDLTTGKIIKVPMETKSQAECLAYARQHCGCGVMFDHDGKKSHLGFINAAGVNRPTSTQGGVTMMSFESKDIPQAVTITAKDGKQYSIVIRKAENKGVTLEYERAPHDDSRLRSMSNLRQLAVAWVLYADKNDGKIAESMDKLEPYLEVEMYSWLQENVVLLEIQGDFQYIRQPSQTPIAYDKTFLAEHGRRIVAFADGHSEADENDGLKELLDKAIKNTQRVQAMKKLRHACIGFWIWADKHQAILPDSIEQIEFESEELKGWAKANIEYLGQGKILSEIENGGQEVIAYNKTLLKTHDGTTLLFADGHVEFLKQEDLKKHFKDVYDKIKASTSQTEEKEAEQVHIEARFLLLPKGIADMEDFASLFIIESENFAPVVGGSQVLNAERTEQFIKLTNNLKEAKLMAAPKLLVQDNEEAEIRIAEEVPVVGEDGQVIRRNIGPRLSITPHVSPKGHIRTEIDWEYSYFTDKAQKSISTSSQVTTVVLQRGDSLLLGPQEIKKEGQPTEHLYCMISPRIIEEEKTSAEN